MIKDDDNETIDSYLEFYSKYDIPGLFIIYLEEKLCRAELEYD